MPREIVSDANDARFGVEWGERDAFPLLTSWRAERLPDGTCGGWTPTSCFALDRKAINKLIRDLRRARDAKFGRDA